MAWPCDAVIYTDSFVVVFESVNEKRFPKEDILLKGTSALWIAYLNFHYIISLFVSLNLFCEGSKQDLRKDWLGQGLGKP